jgi:hypothetical protein
MPTPAEQVDPHTRRIGDKPRKPAKVQTTPAANVKPPSTGPPPEAPLTLSVPEAGRRYFNLGRNASYAAAERGDIPTIRIGKILRVPVRAMEKLLDTAI